MKDPEAFPEAISSVEDIEEMINIFEILRRSSNSHVLSGGRFKRPDIDFVKR